jgi:hypothetical protein
MKLKYLKALLENYPEDMEVLIVYKDNYREHIEDEFAIRQYPMNYCVYTTKWESNIEYYSFTENTCEYRDEIDGRLVDGEIVMERKEVVILEV